MSAKQPAAAFSFSSCARPDIIVFQETVSFCRILPKTAMAVSFSPALKYKSTRAFITEVLDSNMLQMTRP
uniref:Uncharacterized protein n=1 Tax=Arundo donax TaxID=35708 RepID=A0A0A9AE48_ARUDO